MRQGTKKDLIGMAIKGISTFVIIILILATRIYENWNLLLLIPIPMISLIYGVFLQVKGQEQQEDEKSERNSRLNHSEKLNESNNSSFGM